MVKFMWVNWERGGEEGGVAPCLQSVGAQNVLLGDTESKPTSPGGAKNDSEYEDSGHCW